MKLLKITANNFKLCEDNFTISFVPTGNKTEEDKEFELSCLDENLYTFNTIGIVGKNASGKTTALELIYLVYDIMSYFRVKNTINFVIASNKLINLDIIFYNNGYLYRYITDLKPNTNVVFFENQKLYKRKYYKTSYKDVFDVSKYELINSNISLPEDTSRVYEVLNNISIRGLYFSSNDSSYKDYDKAFDIYNMLNNKTDIISSVIKMFDEHIKTIKKLDEDKYKIYYKNNDSLEVNSKDLYNILSSGTTKGLTLYTLAIYSLITGSDLVVDEIENHFHKTLVENLINLYKDKSTNKNNASLIFTTHYAELLDLFGRSDNIYITKYDKKIKLENIYKDYNIRPELLKSKKFYNNAFNTAVDYDALMNFKKELM